MIVGEAIVGIGSIAETGETIQREGNLVTNIKEQKLNIEGLVGVEAEINRQSVTEKELALEIHPVVVEAVAREMRVHGAPEAGVEIDTASDPATGIAGTETRGGISIRTRIDDRLVIDSGHGVEAALL